MDDWGRIYRALARAEEEARRLLSRALGERASHYRLVLSASRGPGEVTLTVDVEAYRPGYEGIDDLVEAVVERAVRVFEEEIGVKPRGIPGKGRGPHSHP